MKWIKVLLLMFTPGAPWIMKWLATHKASQHLGQAAPDTSAVDGAADSARRVYFFHAPYCGPCHAMMPMIDSLRADYPNLVKIDVTEHPELALAFGVSATPMFIVVRQNAISEVKLGTRRAEWLKQQLRIQEAGTAPHSL